MPNAAASADTPGSPSVKPGDRLGNDGRYELIARVGTGGMGSVFRARDHKLGCERAIKVLYPRFSRVPAFVERFRREAMAASRITHPNIVGVVDVAGPDEQPVYLVMELLEGRTLSQLVRGGGRLPWAKVRTYVDQIAAGLGAAHAQGVVHRDVKPGNCVVLPGDQVKVLDFGIAKVTDMPTELVALTAVGEIIGTCSYMAPEQIRGKVDRRSDIYALGAVVFRLLTGRVPFAHDDQDKVLLAHLKEAPPRPSELCPDLPEGVDDLVLTMLAKSPDDRFADMDALRRA
ncbi:MAG: serine/threonine-protein kinase, partial [Nannocystaceae bacterium]